jgi:hypothetical protein
MSRDVEYSVLPSRTSGGRYHNVTTSWEYVWEGTDFALARPEKRKRKVALKSEHQNNYEDSERRKNVWYSYVEQTKLG